MLFIKASFYCIRQPWHLQNSAFNANHQLSYVSVRLSNLLKEIIMTNSHSRQILKRIMKTDLISYDFNLLCPTDYVESVTILYLFVITCAVSGLCSECFSPQWTMYLLCKSVKNSNISPCSSRLWYIINLNSNFI